MSIELANYSIAAGGTWCLGTLKRSEGSTIRKRNIAIAVTENPLLREMVPEAGDTVTNFGWSTGGYVPCLLTGLMRVHSDKGADIGELVCRKLTLPNIECEHAARILFEAPACEGVYTDEELGFLSPFFYTYPEGSVVTFCGYYNLLEDVVIVPHRVADYLEGPASLLTDRKCSVAPLDLMSVNVMSVPPIVSPPSF